MLETSDRVEQADKLGISLSFSTKLQARYVFTHGFAPI